jgi:PAS domain S-box-containing protein
MNSFRRWLKDIPAQTPLERRIASLLQIVLIALIVLTLLTIGLSVLAYGAAALSPRILVPNGIFVVIMVIALTLLRRGYFKLTWWIVIGAIMLVETYSLLASPLVRAGANLLVFMIPLSIAGLLISRPALIVVLLVSFVIIAGDVLLELSSPDAVFTPYLSPMILYVFVAGFVSMLIDLVGTTFRQELARSIASNAELARLSKRMEVTLNSIGDAVIATDGQGRITLMNPVAQHLTGWRLEESTGRPLSDVFHIINEDSREIVESPATQVMREGVIVGLANHTLLIARDGREIPIDDSGAPIREGDGAIEGVVLVFRDVTERKAVENELFETRERLRLKLDSIKDYGIFSLDPGGRIRTWHTGAEEVFGYSAEEAIGQHVGIIYTPEDRARGAVEEEISRALTTGYALDERWHLRKNSSRFFASGVLRPMRDPAGKLHGFVKVARDVTDRIQLQQRQAELLQREQAAREAAEKANLLKLQFLAMISHELRTPLTSIKGFVTTLLAEDITLDNHSQDRYLRIIDEEADRLRELVEDLLDLSQVQAGVLMINPQEQALVTIVDRVKAQLYTLARSHELSIYLPEDLPSIKADTHRIGQVITNLVSNAAKYSPAKTQIKITAEAYDGMVHVNVADQGEGIAPQDRELVFEAFRQADRKRNRYIKGAGLGLAICKGLIEAHGGQIWIQNQEMPGTTITFTIPVANTNN